MLNKSNVFGDVDLHYKDFFIQTVFGKLADGSYVMYSKNYGLHDFIMLFNDRGYKMLTLSEFNKINFDCSINILFKNGGFELYGEAKENDDVLLNDFEDLLVKYRSLFKTCVKLSSITIMVEGDISKKLILVEENEVYYGFTQKIFSNEDGGRVIITPSTDVVCDDRRCASMEIILNKDHVTLEMV